MGGSTLSIYLCKIHEIIHSRLFLFPLSMRDDREVVDLECHGHYVACIKGNVLPTDELVPCLFRRKIEARNALILDQHSNFGYRLHDLEQ
jgi:hypothetical protein